MGNELQEARSSEDDVEHPPVKKNKREIKEDHNGECGKRNLGVCYCDDLCEILMFVIPLRSKDYSYQRPVKMHLQIHSLLYVYWLLYLKSSLALGYLFPSLSVGQIF